VSTDTLATKRDLALAMGADAVVDAAVDDLAGVVREELGESADVVFDCVATQVTLGEATKMAIKGAPWWCWEDRASRQPSTCR